MAEKNPAPTPEPTPDERGGANVPTSKSAPAINVAKVPDPRPAPVAVPAFISEGSATELLLTGKATDPRTGDQLVTGDLPANRVSSLAAPK